MKAMVGCQHIDTQSDKEVELMNEDIARNVCTK